MYRLEWDEKYETGVPPVDYEHRRLFDAINDMMPLLETGSEKEKTEDALGEIYAEISAHFALEETKMREMRYDRFDEHKEDHERLLDEIVEIIDGFRAGNPAHTGQALQERLDIWFTKHIRLYDADLHTWLADRNASAF